MKGKKPLILKSRVWFQTKLHSTQFNYHHLWYPEWSRSRKVILTAAKAKIYNILVMQSFRIVYHGTSHESLVFSRNIHKPSGECVYQVNISEKVRYSMIYHERALYSYFIARHRIYSGQHNQCDRHDGMVGYNTVEYTTAFLYSDWLYFLWWSTRTSFLTKQGLQSQENLTISHIKAKATTTWTWLNNYRKNS